MEAVAPQVPSPLGLNDPRVRSQLPGVERDRHRLTEVRVEASSEDGVTVKTVPVAASVAAGAVRVNEGVATLTATSISESTLPPSSRACTATMSLPSRHVL